VIGRASGTVVAAHGLLIDVRLPAAGVGDGARIYTRDGTRITARVAAVDGRRATLAPLGPVAGVAAGDRVECDASALTLVLGTPLLGRACDAIGAPLDGKPGARGAHVLVDDVAASPGDRRAVTDIFWTGVRAIDGPLAFGRGARIGLFGAPGCGKSTLLESIASGSNADATVVGLVGERGREAERWLARVDARTTVICATSDRSAAERVRAAEAAFAQADALARRGLHVVLILDSLARVAAAAREVALAAGEPAGRGGYPPSAFALLARLLERAGNFATGSITLIATVLSDGADEREPVSDACRAALDGHIALSPRLAQAGRFPAIDLPASASRTIGEVADPAHLRGARALREAVARLEETREARTFGLDPAGADPVLARALAAQGHIERFLRQDSGPSGPLLTLTELSVLADMLTDGYLR
jgi:FliI/YscN family ATPase